MLRAFLEKRRQREFLASAVDPSNAEVKSLAIQRIRPGGASEQCKAGPQSWHLAIA
jgi:hypothetical protein